MKNKTEKIAIFGMLIALAFIFSYLEHLLPLPAPPGVKVGIANLVVMVALYLLGTRDAFVISIIRVVLVGFTFGNLGSMMYSLAGALLSFGVMALMKHSGKFGVPGVSVAGGILHNLGQIVVYMLFMQNADLFLLFPMYAVTGTVAGIVVGIVATLVIKRLKKYVR